MIVTVLVLIWANILVAASPLTKSSSSLESAVPIDTKSNVGQGNYLEMDDDNSNGALDRIPLAQFVRPNPYESAYSDLYDQTERESSIPVNRLLEHIYIANSRLPRRSGSNTKRAAAMGVDLPDYILHMNKHRNFDFSQFRERMQKSG
ncbi:hypothetical protein RDWZM_006947 [Blomia tropicalis]|uniref:Uncharacterized protein n=1 Tax=Blomia tropicalis TaxID=40697 RepID=A0A9Q0MCA6_BLOTA|nr:hypothetical protein RDWZM_006947 [Blomia tropicalis]